MNNEANTKLGAAQKVKLVWGEKRGWYGKYERNEGHDLFWKYLSKRR